MEVHFFLMVFAALVGLVINAIWGFNPIAIIGSLALLILVSPIISLVFQTDPQIVQEIADNFVNRVISAIPSLVIGELAGSIATTIFKSVKNVL